MDDDMTIWVNSFNSS